MKHNNIDFLTPIKISILGLLIYIILYMISPIILNYSPSIMSIILFVSIYIFFWMGNGLVYFSYNLSIKHKSIKPKKYHYSNFFIYTIMFLGLIGAVMRLYDKFFIRGISLMQSTVERESILQLHGATYISLLASFIFPLSLALIFFVLKNKKYSKIMKLSSILLFIYPIYDVALTGKRGLILISISLLLFYLIYLKMLKIKISHILLFIFAVLSFLYFSYLIFLDRITTYGFDGYFSVYNSGYAFTMIPSSIAGDLILQGGFVGTVMFIYINFLQYYLHGLFEWSYLYDHFQIYEHLYGEYTFGLFYKFMNMIGFSTLPIDLESSTPRFAVYTTFLGPLYVDFGFFSFPFMFLFGMFTQLIWFKIKIGKEIYVPIYAYLSTVIFFFPVVNLIQSGLGLYVFISFSLLILIYKISNIRIRK